MRYVASGRVFGSNCHRSPLESLSVLDEGAIFAAHRKADVADGD
jgi:hypothetical protein